MSDGKAIGTCPVCKGEVKEKRSVFACDTPNCFVIFKEVASKKISEAQAKQLLTKGETAELKGFKSKAGKTFAAKLVLKDGKVAFGFAEQKNEETSLKCPTCGGKMMDKGTRVECENSTQENRHVSIFKTIASKKISDKHIEQLITKGETDLIEGFKSKAGKAFAAKLKLSGEKIEFVFDNAPKSETK